MLKFEKPPEGIHKVRELFVATKGISYQLNVCCGAVFADSPVWVYLQSGPEYLLGLSAHPSNWNGSRTWLP